MFLMSDDVGIVSAGTRQMFEENQRGAASSGST